MSIDRDALAVERDFLLRSIEDLDAEHAAGDIDEADYTALRDDYVARAADALRAIDAGPSQTRATPEPASVKKTALIVVGCITVAAVAGFALASALGSRSSGDALSGSLPTSTADQLQQAAELMGEGEAVEAVKVYDQILKRDPEQPVALAYRGWIVRLAGLKDEGLSYVDRAIASDPTYPDAHFFRGMMLWQDKSDPAGAVDEFRLFLANNPPQAMVSLVEDALQRAAAEAGIPTE